MIILKKIKEYLISIGIFYLVLVILLLIASLVFAYTNIQANYIDSVLYFSIGTSSFISSFILSKGLKQNGIINGIILNIIAVLVLFIISSILNGKIMFSNKLFIYLVETCVTGILGGILGVNV